MNWVLFQRRQKTHILKCSWQNVLDFDISRQTATLYFTKKKLERDEESPSSIREGTDVIPKLKSKQSKIKIKTTDQADENSGIKKLHH